MRYASVTRASSGTRRAWCRTGPAVPCWVCVATVAASTREPGPARYRAGPGHPLPVDLHRAGRHGSRRDPIDVELRAAQLRVVDDLVATEDQQPDLVGADIPAGGPV